MEPGMPKRVHLLRAILVGFLLCLLAAASPLRQPGRFDHGSSLHERALSVHHDGRDVLSREGIGLAPRQSAQSATFYPTAFDGSLGDNFTQTSCPAFFHDFLNDQNFVSCHPISMMLQTSNSFFQASKSLVLLTHALDASCTANATACSRLMSAYSNQLRSECANDYQLGNPLVTMAYAGFVSYAPVYAATCLRDISSSDAAPTNSTRTMKQRRVSIQTTTRIEERASPSATSPETTDNGYCFANAMTNVSNPSAVYLYYLPLGISLPGGTNLACSYCTKTTMNTFVQYAGNASQPLHNTYGPAVTQVNEVCGPTFANTNVPRTSGAGGSMYGSNSNIFGLAVAFLASIFLL